MTNFQPREPQKEILKYRAGRLGISAVPGSGKTTIIAVLAARLIVKELPDDAQVLVVTYQNSAVDNVRARIAGDLRARGRLQLGYNVRTLHSLAYGIINAHPGLAGTTSDFHVLDEQASSGLLDKAVRLWSAQNRHVWEDLLPDAGESPYRRQRRWHALAGKVARTVISTAKNRRLSPAALLDKIVAAGPDNVDLFLRISADVYQLYQQQVETLGAVDFNDLVWMAVDLLENHPDVTERLRRQWPYVLEDEAQDSVPLQEELLGLLVGESGNWVRVGDPNQAIMSTFTAADPRHLRRFLQRDDVQVHELPESGRSAPRIIDLANHLVRWVCHQHPLPEVRERAFRLQEIEPTRPGDPQQNPPDAESRIAFRTYPNRSRELADVAQRAKQFIEQHPDRTAGILVRTNATGYRLAEQLRGLGADFDEVLQSTTSSRQVADTLGKVLGFLGDPLSKGALAGTYAALRDDIVDGAAGNTDEVTTLLRSVYRPETLLFPAPDTQPEDALPPVGEIPEEHVDAVRTLAGYLRRWLRATALPVDQLVMTIAQDIYIDASLATAQKVATYLRTRAEENPEWRLPELARELELVAGGRFIGLTDADYGFEPKPGVITLTTMHRAKGLEWDLVYLVGVDGRWFPHTLDDHFIGEFGFPGGDPNEEAKAALLSLIGELEPDGHSATETAHLETIAESLRLLYVGITRAKRYLSISWAREEDFGMRTWRVPAAAAFIELRRWYRKEHGGNNVQAKFRKHPE